MPRYEFSEGSSNKFWEINLAGTSFTTTYGKIGTPGQTTQKSYGSDAEAKKEHDKLIAEKVKKGYEPVKGGKPAKAAAPEPAKAATKVATKVAKPAKKGSSSSVRYFEFSEGSSNKFWSIWIEGTTVMTKYGRIGASGSQTAKDAGSDERATKEYDKLVNEKTKKGYEEMDAPD